MCSYPKFIGHHILNIWSELVYVTESQCKPYLALQKNVRIPLITQVTVLFLSFFTPVFSLALLLAVMFFFCLFSAKGSLLIFPFLLDSLNLLYTKKVIKLDNCFRNKSVVSEVLL